VLFKGLWTHSICIYICNFLCQIRNASLPHPKCGRLLGGPRPGVTPKRGIRNGITGCHVVRFP
jgi:hypothetical protein